MKKEINKISDWALAFLIASPLEVHAQLFPQLGKDSMENVIATMTVEEKVSILVGTGSGSLDMTATIGNTADLIPGAAGSTCAIPRLGIPPLVLADGPAGLRINATRQGADRTFYCTHFPIATLLASTWNIDLTQQAGNAMGNEALEYGVDILLAPATNIHRNPLNGRNFEYYSEDPLLSGKIAASFIRGVQQNGVGTSLKHFALNNQETNRTGNDVIVSERTMREIYLKPFEIAVKEAAPWTVMSSYNKINGIYASENSLLLDSILRNEWGFKGFVVTDWYGGKNTIAQIQAGNDLLMPGSDTQRHTLLKAIREGTLPIRFVDRDIKHLLEQIVKSPRFKKYAYSNQPDLKKHAEIARSVATEGLVLLKNHNQTLPLDDSVKTIAAFGVTSYNLIAGGTGSGDVNRAYTISLAQGLNNAGLILNDKLQKQYETYIKDENRKLPESIGWRPQEMIPEMVLSNSLVNELVQKQDAAIITIGRSSGEFMDRRLKNDFEMSEKEQKLIDNVCTAFHKANKKVIVVLNIGGVIETASWKEKPDAILLAWQAGQEGGNAIADILKGSVTPSGKLPTTFPLSYQDVPSYAHFPIRDEISDKEIDETLITSDNERKDRKNFDYTTYEEEIWVGYRYYDKSEKKVSYPFGYGLSYTSFTYNTMQIKPDNDEITIACNVKNTGKRAGKEVIQLYVSAPGKDLPKPVKELKGFAKTTILQPNEQETISITIPKATLASFNEKTHSWVVEKGKYRFQIASSSQDIHLESNCIIND